MKVKRQKQTKHELKFYKNIFKFHEPYLILIDGTFAQKAVGLKIDMKEKIAGYLGGTITCCTTSCILNELKQLGTVTDHARIAVQKFQLRHCDHKDNPVSAVNCIKSLLSNPDKGRYFVATQDKNLTEFVRHKPATPILYLHKNVIVLEKMSKKTTEEISKLSEAKLYVGLPSKVIPKDKVKKRKFKKKVKGPNPLSCKKKKKKKD